MAAGAEGVVSALQPILRAQNAHLNFPGAEVIYFVFSIVIAQHIFIFINTINSLYTGDYNMTYKLNEKKEDGLLGN